jgi:hypothetical protein
MGCVNRYSIKRGSYISELCRTPGNSDQVQCDVDSVDIVFKRPNPDAILTVIKNNGQMPNPAASAVHIKLTSADGSNTRTVVVQENGLIYIQPVTAN